MFALHLPQDPIGYYRCLRTATLLHGFTPTPTGCFVISAELYLQCCESLAAIEAQNQPLITLGDELARN